MTDGSDRRRGGLLGWRFPVPRGGDRAPPDDAKSRTAARPTIWFDNSIIAHADG